MKPEDILKAAQEQSRKEGELEYKIHNKGAVLSAVVALLLLAVMFYVEYFFLHKVDYGKPAIILAISTASDLYDGIKLKDKKKIIIGIVCFLLFAVCMVMYIGALLK